MQQSPNISVYEYEYQPNVKQKVKMLEASMYTKEDEKFRTSKSSRTRSISESSALSSTAGSEEVPAVMEVEITQMSSLPSNSEKDSIGEVNGGTETYKRIILKNENAAQTDEEDEIETPKDVKSLLKKFTDGVSNTASNLRRKSAGFVEFRNNGKSQNVSSYRESPLVNSQPQSPNATETFPDKNVVKVAPTKRGSFSFASFKSTPKIPDLIESTESPVKIEESYPKNVILNKPKRFWNRKASAPVIDTVLLEVSPVNEINNNTSLIESKGDENHNFNSEDSNEVFPTSELSVVQRIAKYDEAISSSKSAEETYTDSKEFGTTQKPTPKPRTGNLSIKKDALTGSILVIGPQNCGKSSIVNYLVRQDILPVHKNRLTTSELVECTATIKSEVESDSEDQDSICSLKIIDSPGFNNEEQDASLVSTLLGYINDTEGLNKFPTLLLVPVKYKKTGNYSDYSEFVNFLKCISHFQDKLFDSKGTFQNILFVLTHLPLEESHINENVRFELSNLISKYTPMVKPMIVYHYPLSQSDKVRSLNPFEMESIPQTGLIDGIRKLIADASNQTDDGHAVLTSAFSPNYPKSIVECSVSKRLPLKGPEYPAVIKMEKLLHNVYFDAQIEPTEISTLLEIGWENIDPELRKKYQSSLLTLQQVFQNQNIKTFSDLPEEPLKVLEILNQIPFHNLAVTDLLKETIQLQVPSCFPALYVGQGYDVSKDVVTGVSPFQFSGNLKTSPVGLIPEEISCKLTEDREIVFKFFTSYADYVLDRFKDLSIKYVTFPTSNPPLLANQRSGYNVVKPNQEPTKSTIATALIEYRAFHLSLCTGEDVDFKPIFWDTISTIPDLDIKKPETIVSWKEFFEYWGTHVVKSAYGGGSIQVNFRGKMLTNIFKSLKQDSVLPSDEYDTSKVFQYITGDGLSYVTTTEGSKSEFIQGFDVDTRFQGGDMKFQQMDLTKLAHDKVSEIRKEWIQSLLLNPVILETNLALVPISFFVRAKSEGIATKMDVAFHHFYANFMALQGKSSCSIL